MFAEQNSTISKAASVKPLPELKKRVLSPLQHSKHNFSFGSQGEADAVRFLTSKDYVVLGTNIRFKNQELDIIALDTKLSELVFIEVKTRSSSQNGHPSTAVTTKKINSMNAVAKEFLKKHSYDFDYRFDIITVTGKEIEHFENVTWNS